MAERLARPGQTERVVKAVRALTNGRPLILNFEGVLLPDPPVKPAGPYQLWMDPKVALPLLEKLGVKAATLANNHSGDYGEEGCRRTREVLEGAAARVHHAQQVAEAVHTHRVEGAGAPDLALDAPDDRLLVAAFGGDGDEVAQKRDHVGLVVAGALAQCRIIH